MQFCAKIVYGWNVLTVFTRGSILDVWQGSKYASARKALLQTPDVSIAGLKRLDRALQFLSFIDRLNVIFKQPNHYKNVILGPEVLKIVGIFVEDELIKICQ